MKQLLNGQRIIAGVCYYPEHWQESDWENDLRRMKAAGLEVVRIAEFAWNKVEPQEGIFDYSFFDRFLETAKQEGIKVIFCTPTATPPAWASVKYPEILNTLMDGTKIQHGSRRHYNYNSPKYLELSAKITEAFASHYAKHESIIGWQLDNEFNCENDCFYSESDTIAFRKWLQEKYETLDNLNESWGTVFWNQTYTDWNEVDVPRTTNNQSVNPHRVLDYYRFISDSCCAYAKIQSDILRKYIKPGDFITTNGIFGNLDYQKLTKESLDFITYDSYPNFAYCIYEDPLHSTDLNDRKWSRNLAEIRAISPIFGIMEQQSGANGWNTRMEAPTPRPGQIKLWTMQSIGHGADYVSYFRWRTCTFGTEMYWHGILDYSGRDNRRLREVTETTNAMKQISEVAGSTFRASVGILCDYDNQWDSRVDNWHRRLEDVSRNGLFQGLQVTHTPYDYIYLTKNTTAEQLKKYTVLFYPHACLMNEAVTALLEDYVKAGGTLIFGARSGYKDMRGQCVRAMLPGLLRPLTGADIPEYSLIAPDIESVQVAWGEDTLEAAVFTEQLDAIGADASVTGVYTNDYYAGSGAVVENSFGSGKVYYYGSTFTRETTKTFLKRTGVLSPYSSLLQLPECCELTVREKDGISYFFVLNYSKQPVEITLKMPLYDLEAQQEFCGAVTVEGYGTRVYRK